MKKSIRKRKPKQKLLLHWIDDPEFAVPVAVHPRTEPRFLKNYTILIHAIKPAVTSLFDETAGGTTKLVKALLPSDGRGPA